MIDEVMKLVVVVSLLFALWALPLEKSELATACDLVALGGASYCMWLFANGRKDT